RDPRRDGVPRPDLRVLRHARRRAAAAAGVRCEVRDPGCRARLAGSGGGTRLAVRIGRPALRSRDRDHDLPHRHPAVLDQRSPPRAASPAARGRPGRPAAARHVRGHGRGTRGHGVPRRDRGIPPGSASVGARSAGRGTVRARAARRVSLGLVAWLTFLWLLLNQTLSPAYALLGLAAAVGITWAFSPLRPLHATISEPLLIPGLLFSVLMDVIRSNIAVARIVLGLTRGPKIRSGFLDIPDRKSVV